MAKVKKVAESKRFKDLLINRDFKTIREFLITISSFIKKLEQGDENVKNMAHNVSVVLMKMAIELNPDDIESVEAMCKGFFENESNIIYLDDFKLPKGKEINV